jgi:hypothetical protein
MVIDGNIYSRWWNLVIVVAAGYQAHAHYLKLF